jgi:PhnB protein
VEKLTFNNSPVDLVDCGEYLQPYTHPNFLPAKECASIFQFPGGFMSNAVRPIPEGFHSLTPYITCRDAAAAIDFYKNVLGATELVRMPGPDGRVMHAELQIGDSRLMLNDEFPGMAAAPSPTAVPSSSVFLYTEDVDALVERAVQAGARVDMPLSNMFWGDRFGKFTDPFGHQWGVATHVEEVAPEEMQRRSEEMTKQMAKAAGQSN